jgi:hypothetical protein
MILLGYERALHRSKEGRRLGARMIALLRTSQNEAIAPFERVFCPERQCL